MTARKGKQNAYRGKRESVIVFGKVKRMQGTTMDRSILCLLYPGLLPAVEARSVDQDRLPQCCQPLPAKVIHLTVLSRQGQGEGTFACCILCFNLDFSRTVLLCLIC